MTGRYLGEPPYPPMNPNDGPFFKDDYVGPPELASHKSEGKPLVNDLDPLFWLEMGEVMTQGLTKYPNDPDGTPNWYKGGSFRGFIASIQRHAMRLAAGEDVDRESGLPHAAHIAVDAMFVRSWQVREVGQDDRLTQSGAALAGFA